MKIRHYFYSALLVVLAGVVSASAKNICEAAKQGDLLQVETWVEKDPQLVNFKDEESRTPLHWASRGVHMDVLEYLVENGADVNARDADKVTPLHSLSYRGNAKAMEILIKKGADVDMKEVNGMSSLMYAAYAGQEAAAVILIKHGANAKTRDDTGLTVADIAEDQGYAGLARYLISAGAELTPIADPEITELPGNIHRITFCYQQCTNILAVDGPDDVLVIDTGYVRTTEKLKTAITNISKGKSITVINTHQHPDHIGGNSMTGDNGTIISHENLEQMTSSGILDKNAINLQGASGTEYEGSYTLSFNHRTVRLIPLPGAHTDGDLLVYFEDAGVVHMGDLLISQSFPSLTRGKKVIEYLAILDEVIDIFDDRTIFVGGHGRNLQKQELVAYRNMLNETIDIVTRGLKEGKNVESMQQDGVLDKYVTYDTFIPMLNTGYWIETVSKTYKERPLNLPTKN